MKLTKQVETQAVKKKKLTVCPHCGSTQGYYTRVKYSGIGHLYFDFDDNVLETLMHSGFYDHADWKEYKTKCCMKCNKNL